MINSWSIYDNSCSKNKSVYICVICGRIFVSFELFVFAKNNPCYLWLFHSFSFSFSSSFTKYNLCISVQSVGKQDHLMVSEYAGAVPRNSSAYAQTAVALPEW